MSAPLLSIICYIHNSESTLERMLDSILSEGLNNDEFEIIACDDCSTDSSLEILHQFVSDNQDISISILRTEEQGIHSAANTRKYGLSEAKGEWVRFIDGDDEFVNQGSKKFFEYISNQSCPKVLVKSEVVKASHEGDIVEYIPTNTTILHGNFYNRYFIERYDINFLPEMKLFEDMYFNSCFFSNVFYFGNPELDFGYMNDVTYKWTFEEDNASSQLYKDSKGHVEIHFIKDWLKGAFLPFEKYLHIWPVPNIHLFQNRICQITSGLYFYYENALYRKSIDNIDESVISYSENIISQYFASLNRICKNSFRTDVEEMLYQYPDIFCEQYSIVTSTNDYFVPQHSFKQFIQMMM